MTHDHLLPDTPRHHQKGTPAGVRPGAAQFDLVAGNESDTHSPPQPEARHAATIIDTFPRRPGDTDEQWMSQARIAAAEVINTARTKRVEATEEDPGDLTREERAHRERLQAEQDTIEQWIEDIANGVFDLSKLKIVDGVPQVYAYRWKHPHTGRIILRYSGSMLS